MSKRVSKLWGVALAGLLLSSCSSLFPSETLDHLEIRGELEKSSYQVGERWNKSGLTLIAVYSTGAEKNITSNGQASWSFSPKAPASGVRSVTVNGTFGGKTATPQIYNVTCVDPNKAPATLVVSGTLSKAEYTVGESWSTDGLELLYANGDIEKDLTGVEEVNWTFSPEAPEADAKYVTLQAEYEGTYSQKKTFPVVCHEQYQTHHFDGPYQFDDSKHWKVCSDEGCDQIGEVGTHEFGDWATVQEPTCEENGIKKRVCSVCGYEQTAPIEAKGHDLIDGWQSDASYHWRNCGNDASEQIDKSEHAFEMKYTGQGEHPATCTEDGLGHRECSICGYALPQETIPCSGHQWVEDESEENHVVTCTEDGRYSLVCSVCGAKKSETVPAMGHVFEEITYSYDENYSVCTATQHCSRESCGAVRTATSTNVTPTVISAAKKYNPGVTRFTSEFGNDSWLGTHEEDILIKEAPWVELTDKSYGGDVVYDSASEAYKLNGRPGLTYRNSSGISLPSSSGRRNYLGITVTYAMKSDWGNLNGDLYLKASSSTVEYTCRVSALERKDWATLNNLSFYTTDGEPYGKDYITRDEPVRLVLDISSFPDFKALTLYSDSHGGFKFADVALMSSVSGEPVSD